MMGRVMALAAVATALAAVELAAQPARNPGARHQQLQEQVFRRFLDVAGKRLELREEQREELGQLMRDGQQRRRELARELAEARRELARLSEEGGDTEALARQLERVETLRRQEFELWQREQDALGQLLTPKQHADFLVLQMRLNDRVRELRRPGGRQDRPPMGPPGVRRPPF